METIRLNVLIANLKPRFEERKVLSRQVENVKDFEWRRDQLKIVVDDVRPVVKQAELLKSNYELQAQLPLLEKVRINTQTMLDQYSTEPEKILAVGDSWFDNWKHIIKDLKEAIDQYWSLFKTTKLFQINEFEFNLLEMFDEYKQIRKQLTLLKDKLEFLVQDKAPTEQSQWDEIKSLNEQIRKTWFKVSWAGLPEEMKLFIYKAKGSGVAVSDYNTSIQTWLQKHGLEKYFVIKVAGRNG
jgi:hypothetical protein